MRLCAIYDVPFCAVALPESSAGRVVSFFKPGVDLITRFLPMFFVPALIVLPLSARCNHHTRVPFTGHVLHFLHVRRIVKNLKDPEKVKTIYRYVVRKTSAGSSESF